MQRNLSRILYILCGLCAFVLGMKQLREPDIWWQLLSGRWMLEHGQVTKTDMFSYTMAGQRWVNVKWLYEVIIAGFEKLIGAESVLLLQSLVNVAIVYLLIQTVRSINKVVDKQVPLFATIISLLLFLGISEYRMAGRPEMVSHLLCTVYLFILWRNPRFEWKKIWWLIPLQCLWANMHEGYPVGIVIVGTMVGGSLVSYLITKERKQLQQTIRALILLAACILVILLNPNTTQLWQQPFEIYRQVWANKYTTELYSYKDAAYWTLQAKWHWALTALAFIYWAIQMAAVAKTKQIRTFFSPVVLTYLFILVLFSYLALTANRNIPFAQIALLPSVVLMFAWLNNKLQRIGIYKTVAEQAGVIAIFISVAFYISIVSNKWYKYTASPNKFGIHTSMLHNPTGAAAFIKDNNIKGLAFSDYFVSSYLLWDMYPSFKSYIDLRDLDVFPVSFFDDYFNLYSQPDKFDTLDKKYNFNYVVLSTSQLTALQMKLYWGKGYNMIYVDPVSAIFMKQNEVNKALNSNLSIQKLFSWPQAAEDPVWATAINKLLNPTLTYRDEEETEQYVHAALFYNQIRNYTVAIKMLQPQLSSYEDDARAYSTLGSTYMQYASAVQGIDKKNKLDSAAYYLEQAKEIDARYIPNYMALGNLYFSRGDFETAADNLEIFLKNDKSNDFAYFLYGLCNRSLWKQTKNRSYLKQGLDAMKSALKANPQNGKTYLYIAEAEYWLGDKTAARDNMRQLEASGNPLLADEQQLRDNLKQLLGIK